MLVRTAVGLPTWKPPKLDVNRRTTIIIDECAMANSDKLSRAICHAEKAGCRLVLVGDHRQLPAIGPGGLFRELWERARPDQKTELTDIVRAAGGVGEEGDSSGRPGRGLGGACDVQGAGAAPRAPDEGRCRARACGGLEAGGNSEPA